MRTSAIETSTPSSSGPGLAAREDIGQRMADELADAELALRGLAGTVGLRMRALVLIMTCELSSCPGLTRASMP